MATFQEMSLPAEIQKALAGLKFVEPTKIQSAVIPVAMEGKDLMACAETGSGKTGAYGIPMVTALLRDTQKRALVLAPTRELAQQIADFLRDLTNNCNNVKVTALVGGADIRKQFKALQKNPRIIVATPGRLTDHLKRKTISVDATEILVLDEGDRMLDMGFAPQLDVILKYLPKQRQTSLFTATLPEKVQNLAKKYLYKPQKVNVGRTSLPVSTVKQTVVQVTFKEKDDRIVDELNQRKGSVIVFARTKHRTNLLARNLAEYGFDVDIIHGGRTQGQRNKAIQNFKQGRSRILCATDVAARGIDVPQVQHVINFDLPMMSEDYVHRIGRTARNGATGEAVSFVMPEEHREWQSLARIYQIKGVELVGVARGEGRKKRGSSSRKSSSYGDTPYRDRGNQGRSKKKRSFSRSSDEGSSRDERPGKRTFGGKKKSKKKFSKSGGEGSFSRISRSPKKKSAGSSRDEKPGKRSFSRKKKSGKKSNGRAARY